MFDDKMKQPPTPGSGNAPTPKKPVEDIFADTDHAAPKPAPSSMPMPGGAVKSAMHLPWIVLGVLVLVVLIGGGAWLALSGSSDVGDKNARVATENAPGEDQTPTEPSSNSAEPSRDTDRDGLSDTDEENAGTDSTNPDTDGDGLSDRDEVRVYRTDPLRLDTDGDSYSDGKEVEGGYDPNGPGRLKDIERALMEEPEK